MKLRASVSIEMEITDELIIEYENMTSIIDNKLSKNSSHKQIQNYFSKNSKDILEYAKEISIKILTDKCAEVCLYDNYKSVRIDEII
jgi:prophage tail gpP-like protein